MTGDIAYTEYLIARYNPLMHVWLLQSIETYTHYRHIIIHIFDVFNVPRIVKFQGYTVGLISLDVHAIIIKKGTF